MHYGDANYANSCLTPFHHILIIPHNNDNKTKFKAIIEFYDW